MEGVQQGPKGHTVRPKGPKAGVRFVGGTLSPLPPARGLGSTVSSLSGVRSRDPVVIWISYVLSSLDGISCCILGAFCTRKLYAVQHGKGSVRFLEAMWNSKCHITLHQVQLANTQTRHYSYTSA